MSTTADQGERYAMTTPVQVDTALAELAEQQARAQGRINGLGDAIRRALGHKATYVTRTRKQWPTSLEDAIAQARALPAEREARTYWAGPAELLTEFDAATAALDAITARMQPLEAQYQARRWARFFLVQNNDGHIHRERDCSTCYSTTSFVWLPQLSGCDEAAAVAVHGPMLCSVCFPSAKPEWRAGKVKPAGCSGSGLEPVQGTVRRHGMSVWGQCGSCGENQTVTVRGVLRKHNPPKV